MIAIDDDLCANEKKTTGFVIHLLNISKINEQKETISHNYHYKEVKMSFEGKEKREFSGIIDFNHSKTPEAAAKRVTSCDSHFTSHWNQCWATWWRSWRKRNRRRKTLTKTT